MFKTLIGATIKLATLDIIKIENVCFRGLCQESKMTTHRMGENFWQIIYMIRGLYLEYIKTPTTQ